MQNFTFQNSTKVIFGRDKEKTVGTEVKEYSDHVLLHYGGGSIKKYGVYDDVIDSLEEAGVEVTELGGVQPNPRLSLVEEGIEICREKDIDFILAVGGGSVIDSAKSIAAGVPYEGDVWDFFAGEAEIETALPVGTVLTIPAAGSETSPAAVVTNEEEDLKWDIGSNKLRPQFSILNPEITYTLPDYQTACGAADMMAHIMERYFTKTEDVELTDKLCAGTLRTIINNTPCALKEPKNYDARAEIMWAGTIAHNDLLGTGREEDWASHAIEHELSALYDVAHGAGLAVIFPAWMEYVHQEHVERFAQFAVDVWNVDPDFYNVEQTAKKGIEKTREFFSSIGLPVSLEELGVPTNKLEEMADKCTSGGPVGNFKSLDKEDVFRIYKLSQNKR
ncbi:iron-containing alcohol dehydrogenase [Halanaerobacter jeridensis]|uniref:Alcohol dehydrogenase YqhD (Iron-dependent ADH family) n=1 Tax=Halanaerobacter jeridensis TaxID=706427 RepID=A0A939BMC8_9FIRM|nr:alcohol dehydrogenase YqhD (iron-dependent ADH family) [Halanaerobacter jeridensis]